MSAPAPQTRLRPALLLGLLAAAGLAAAALGLALGSEPVRAWQGLVEVLGRERAQWTEDGRILALRLPRVALAWLTGAALAVAGAVLQTLLRNGLATPFTLGVAAASSFGAFLGIAFPAFALPWLGGERSLALGAALLETWLVLAVARRSARADGLLLAGVTLNFLFGAATLFVRYLADPYDLARMDRWLLGSLDATSLATPASLLPWLGAGLLLLLFRVRDLDDLAFDPELAAARGVRVETSRRLLLLATALLTAGVVAHAGPIAFVGLLVPHALRPFLGLRHAALLPACALLGGAFLILADVLARTLPALLAGLLPEAFGRSSELPVGLVTALIGGPFFLALLLRRG